MDIVEQLRKQNLGGIFSDDYVSYAEAADEIERLQKDVENAMDILLTKKQIKFIKSNTFSGPSKKQWVRKLVSIGIKEQIAEWEKD
jgi:uncharacterized protein YpuA (DUF1002 family)